MKPDRIVSAHLTLSVTLWSRDHVPFNRNLEPLPIDECRIFKVMDQLL